MNNWTENLLSNHVSLITKGTTPTSLGKSFKESGINFIKAESITESGEFILDSFAYIDEDTHELLKRSQLHDGDILFSIAGVLGRIAIVNSSILPANTNQAIALIRLSNNTEIESDFLKYFLNSEFIKEQIRRINVQSAQANFSLGDINRLVIKYPKDKPEQRQIATILSTADAVIEKTQAAIAKYKAIKQGMLQDLFTRGIDTKTGKLRPSYQDAPELYKESKLGWIPKEWEVERLENVTDKIGSGVTPTGGSEIYKTSGVLFIRSQNVLVGRLSIEDAAYITTEIDERMESSRVKPLDVLLNITGASIGRCAYFPNELNAANVNQHVCILRFKNSSKDLAVFASEFLNSSFGQSQINKSIAGGSREGLNFQQIKAFYFPIIPNSELEIISRTIETLSNKLQTEQAFLHKQQQIKAGLMGDLLSGRKNVKI
jgi:type I restriction enzyme S subunit